MSVPAFKFDEVKDRLFDLSIKHGDLWLRRVIADLQAAHQRMELSDVDFHDVIGVAFTKFGDLEAALAHAGRAYEEAPRNPVIAHNYAVALDHNDRPDEALEVLKRIESPRTAIHLLRASCFASVGEWKSARSAFAQGRAIADVDNVDDLWRLSHAAAVVGLYAQSVEFMARLLARRKGVDVPTDPLRFVMESEDYAALPVPDDVETALHRVALRAGLIPIRRELPDDDSEAPVPAAFAEFAPLRDAATRAGLGHAK